jgi:hypothetical protein
MISHLVTKKNVIRGNTQENDCPENHMHVMSLNSNFFEKAKSIVPLTTNSHHDRVVCVLHPRFFYLHASTTEVTSANVGLVQVREPGYP